MIAISVAITVISAALVIAAEEASAAVHVTTGQ
jgi:hypothetical protein